MDYDTQRAVDDVRGEIADLRRDLEYEIAKVAEDLHSLRNRVQEMRLSLRAET